MYACDCGYVDRGCAEVSQRLRRGEARVAVVGLQQRLQGLHALGAQAHECTCRGLLHLGVHSAMWLTEKDRLGREYPARTRAYPVGDQ